MKTLHVLVLLSSAALICRAAPPLEVVTCGASSHAPAARLAMHHINDNHHHGYKFQLKELRSSSETEDKKGECDIKLELELLETECHNVNPRHFEDCATRSQAERAVVSNCTLMMTVNAAKADITKYDCDTRKEKSDEEMMRICPDCPVLLPHINPHALNSVRAAMKEVNQNTSNQHYYTLEEVGRCTSSYIMSQGMMYFTEFVLVETHCPRDSRILPQACKPLCPNRAHHAFCRSSYTSENGLQSVDCDYYPPTDTTALGPGASESPCTNHHHVLRPCLPPPPPHAQAPGPPRQAGRIGPPHGGADNGPPPQDRLRAPLPNPDGTRRNPHGPPGAESGHPMIALHPCHEFLSKTDPALHSICPWPLPASRTVPTPHQSATSGQEYPTCFLL